MKKMIFGMMLWFSGILYSSEIEYLNIVPKTVYHYYSSNKPLFIDSISDSTVVQNFIYVREHNVIDTLKSTGNQTLLPIYTRKYNGKEWRFYQSWNQNSNNKRDYYWLGNFIDKETLQMQLIYKDWDIYDFTLFRRFDNWTTWKSGNYYFKGGAVYGDTLKFQYGNHCKQNLTAVKSIGVLSITYKCIDNGMIPFLPSIDSLDFNPKHEDIYLKYITLGQDTVFRMDQVISPVLSSRPSSELNRQGSELIWHDEQGVFSASPPKAELLTVNGQVQLLNANYHQGVLKVENFEAFTSKNSQGRLFLKVSNSKTYRLFEVK